MRNPELWDSSDNTEAIAACRLQCQRRFACAQEALTGPRHLVSSLNGVIAGVAIPAQNEYGTSKAHKAALKRLETIAEVGRAARAVTKPGDKSQPAAAPVDTDKPPTSSAANPREHSLRGQTLALPHEPQPIWNQVNVTEVVVMPNGWRATRTPGAAHTIPKGQVDIAGAARMTGLTKQALRNLRRTGGGPKSWLTPGGPRGGLIRYWVADIEAWMAHRQPCPTAPTARAS